MRENEIEAQVEIETDDQAIRDATVQDILLDLVRFLQDAPEHERAGMQAAIEIIQENY